jgi:hypothetical protein
MENFFGTFKTECLYRAHCSTRAEVEQLVTEYVNFYHYEHINLKTASPRLKSGARPRNLMIFYDRVFFFLSIPWGAAQVETDGRVFSYFAQGLEPINQKVYNKEYSDGGAW